MALVSIKDYAREARISQTELRAKISRFGLQPVDKRNPLIFDRHALKRIHPICEQLDLFTPS